MNERRDPPASSGEPPWLARERALLAPYAMHSADSLGRRYPEPPHPYRGPFERDRDRIIHSAAFRRLSLKTQVFTGESGDYHRTRLTHTLEVSQIARTLARALRLHEDLCEALALMHDLGHPPFGHAGEDVLDECLAEDGGFSHNAQALRIVELLEQRYPDFPGLNLSAEMLAGQQTRAQKNSATASPLLEVQVVEAADSIAYNSHDADDALYWQLIALEELFEVPLWAEARRRVESRCRALDAMELRRAIVRELIDWQVGDLVARTSAALEVHAPANADAVRSAPLLVTPSPDLGQQKAEFERFLYQRVYRHPTVLALRHKKQAELRAMFAGYRDQPEQLPPSHQARIAEHGVPRVVGDYIAGMTDRFAQREYQRLAAGR